MRLLYAGLSAFALTGCNEVSVPVSKRLPVPPPPVVKVSAAAFSPDGQRLLIGFSAQNPVLRLWDLPTGKEVWTTLAHQGSVTSVVFLRDGKRAYSAGADGVFKLWNVDTGHEICSTTSGEDRISQIVTMPGEKLLLTAHGGGRIKVWDAVSHQVLRTLEGGPSALCALAISQDDRVLSAHCGDTSYTKIWDIDRGIATRTFSGLGCGYDASFSPDGRYALSPKKDGIATHLVLWNVMDGREVRTFKGHLHGLLFAAFSPDGNRIYSGGFDYVLRCWDRASGEVLWKIQVRKATAYALSHDGKQIFTASGDNDFSPNERRLEIWNTSNGTRARSLIGSPVNPVFKNRGPFD